MNIEQRFGASVRANRTLQGISQKDFAQSLTEVGMSVDASAISRIEAGARSVRLHEAQAIADALKCPMASLLSEESEESSSAVDAILDAAIESLRKLKVGSE